MRKNNQRVYNFGAGPAMLPEPVLREVQQELLDWQNTGISILEMGHRTEEFKLILQEAESDLRQLLNIPTTYEILFVHGPARLQFSAIPLYFLSPNEEAGYIISGLWSDLAFREAQKFAQPYVVISRKEQGFINLPPFENWQIKTGTQYLYLTHNETVNGIRLPVLPSSTYPLFADMTSSLLTETLDINLFDFIFAGAQKNIANAGLCLIIVKKALLAQAKQSIPSLLDYEFHAARHSLAATPPTFNCYLAGKVFKWIIQAGGLSYFQQLNQEKSALLYQFIDRSEFYTCKVAPPFRSLINICFYLRHAHLDTLFLAQAKNRGLVGLKGHQAVGGMRASLYNAMPLMGVEALIEFMDDFAREHG